MIAASQTRLLLLMPSLAIVGALFVAPLSVLFVVSFWQVSMFDIVPDFSLANYRKTLTGYAGTVGFTLAIAGLIALVTTALGFWFAYAIRFHAGRWASALLFVAMLTIFGGYLIKIYAWKTILGASGILNTALLALGIVQVPVEALIFSPAAVVITLCHYLLPFAILAIYGSLRGIDTVTLDAARDLGAPRRRVLATIVLPQCQTGILAAFTLCFLLAAGDYVTPQLVGGTTSSMMGLFIQGQFGLQLNAPLGSAMSFTVLGLCLGIVVAVAWSLRQALRWRR